MTDQNANRVRSPINALKLINQLRKEKGIPPVQIQPREKKTPREADPKEEGK